MGLNYLETIPPSSLHRKIIFHKTIPLCQTGWGPRVSNTRRVLEHSQALSNYKSNELVKVFWK